MKDPFSAGDERCSMLPRRHIMSTGFDTVQVHIQVIEEPMEYADRVASPANTGNHTPWQPAFLLQDLSTGLSADDALEVADHGRVGVWAHYGPEKVVGVFDVGYDRTLSHLFCRWCLSECVVDLVRATM